MINKKSPNIGINFQVQRQYHCEYVDKSSFQNEKVKFFNVKEFIVIEKKNMNQSVFQKEGFCLKSSKKSQEIKQIKQIWEEKEIMSRKQNSEIIRKPKSIETIILACYIIILYMFALVLAPNQYCCSRQ